VIVGAHRFDFDHAFGYFNRTGNDYLHSERKYELFADMADIAADHPESLSVRHTKVSDVWKFLGDTMTFLFDYGDTWRFTVRLVGFGVAESKRKYPRVLKKTGRAPEQYPAADEK
jgi:Plasmid pRiA4b ORF-3-like protein